jgi:hypothetical protein
MQDTLDTVKTDPAEYIRNNYGHCELEPDAQCRCRKTGWLGTMCPHWRPVPAQTWETLGSMMKADYTMSPRAEVREKL